MRPIAFNPENVRRILDGTKTMTRRVVEPQSLSSVMVEGVRLSCPYVSSGGQPDEPMFLWVQEKWCGSKTEPIDNPLRYKADYPDDYNEALTKDHAYGAYQWQPATTMPYWASRIQLKIVTVGIERLQSITKIGAIKEGVPSIAAFIKMWNEINEIRGYGWDENPYVYAILFRKI
jgi:hypothetical protein